MWAFESPNPPPNDIPLLPKASPPNSFQIVLSTGDWAFKYINQWRPLSFKPLQQQYAPHSVSLLEKLVQSSRQDWQGINSYFDPFGSLNIPHCESHNIEHVCSYKQPWQIPPFTCSLMNTQTLMAEKKKRKLGLPKYVFLFGLYFSVSWSETISRTSLIKRWDANWEASLEQQFYPSGW